jgi:uncharacterized lipoprotein
VAVTLVVGGCSLWGNDEPCESVEEYQAAQAAAELSIPAGLDKPDPSARLDIPEEPQPLEPLAKNAACLQQPPNYFDKPLKDSAN